MAGWLRNWRQSLIIGVCACTLVLGLVAAGQPLAAVFALLAGGLVLQQELRNRQTRRLAQALARGQSLEKVEVAQGALGDLCRAVNTLVQEQRLQERIRSGSPHSLPEAGVQALLQGQPGAQQRSVAVLLICGVGSLQRSSQQSQLAHWHTLADATQAQAQTHGALLQPCGESIMLVFGAFTEQPVEMLLFAALEAARALQLRWRGGDTRPLTMSLACGSASITALPGLGYCTFGTPVEQAIHIERQANSISGQRLLCTESVFYALRHHTDKPFQRTDMRILSVDGRPQVVYGIPYNVASSLTHTAV